MFVNLKLYTKNDAGRLSHNSYYATYFQTEEF